jgi:hypothetical protein
MKTTIFISVAMLFLFNGCEKKYDINDISSFEFSYNTGSGYTGYYYNFKLTETGLLDIQLRRPYSDSTRHSVYSVDNADINEFKFYLVDLLNTKIKADYYIEPGQSTDIPGIGISVDSNIKKLNTTISGPAQPLLPESLKRVMEEVTVLQSKYDTGVSF